MHAPPSGDTIYGARALVPALNALLGTTQIQIRPGPRLEVARLRLGRRARVVLLRVVAVRVHDRLDRDGDDRGWKRFIAFALQAVLDGGLVECDEDDDRRRVYRLRRTRTFTFNLAKAMGYEVGGGTGRDTHDEGDEAALDEDAAAEPERVQVGGLRLVLRGEVQREEDGGVHVRVVDP